MAGKERMGAAGLLMKERGTTAATGTEPQVPVMATPAKSTRDWDNHRWDYMAHWASGGLAGVLTFLFPPAGIAFIVALFLYQLGSYWHKKDTLKLDLKDILIGYAAGLVLSMPLAGWIAWMVWQRVMG